MADNTELNALQHPNGDVTRTLSKTDPNGNENVKTQVIAIDKGGAGTENLVTGSNPLTIEYEPFDEVEYLSARLLDTAAIDMAVDGGTPVTYKYTVPADKVLYLKRGFLVIEDGNVAFIPGNFGALGAALTNGVSVGVTPSGGPRVEIENWKTNRQVRDTMFDFDQQFKSDGAYVGRWTFAKDLNFAGMVLGAGDIFDFVIQDNLSTLDYFSFRLKGILKAS